MEKLHLGQARPLEGCRVDPLIAIEELGIHLDLVQLGCPAIAVADQPDEVGAALVDLLQADADDTPERGFLLGEPPPEIDLGEGHAPLAAERADLGEDLFDKMLALLLKIAEGG